jgi:hypothetical protein
MKRIFCLLTLLGLLTTSVGCQNCCSGLRGARCRTGLSTPSFRLPRLQSQPPAAYANPSCNQPAQPVYMSPETMMSEHGAPMYEGPMSGGIVYEQGPVVPTDGSYQIRQRATIPSHIMDDSSTGNVITVPGPESGPVPMN